MSSRLGTFARFAYALPAFALAVVGIPLYVFVPKFYTGVVGVDIALVGWILGAVRIFDAILDPLAGVLSDRTRTRFGRRRPWIVLGSIPLALALVGLLVPAASGPAAATWFGAGMFSLFFFWVTVTVPYESLGLELTDDYDDRTRLLGMRDALGIAGFLAAASMPLAISWALGLGAGGERVETADEQRVKFQVMAAIYAPLLLVFCGLCALFVPERPLPEAPALRGWWDRIRAMLRTLAANRPFVIVLLAYFVNAIGSNLPGLLMQYYVESYLGSPHMARYLALYCVIGVGALPLWFRLSSKIGKKAAWLAAMVVNSGSFFFVVFLGRQHERLYEIIVATSGIGFGATWAIPSSLQADVIDYDELVSGERREGLLVGVWCFLRKLAPALPVGVALPVMKAAGWTESHADQTPQAFFTLKVLYAVVPTVCSAIAIAIAWRYPIDREKHARILAALEARKTGAVVADPLSGS